MAAKVLYKPEVADKHKCYAAAYKAGDHFWGIGIECEAYIETAIRCDMSGHAFLTNQRPERYSVPYYASYKPGIYNEALKSMQVAGAQPTIFDANCTYTVPYLLNAHSLTRVDASGEHSTAFQKVTDAAVERGYRYDLVPNPRFGKSIISQLADADADGYFTIKDGVQGEDFIFDGDSIEIATRAFYKTTIEDCVKEFRHSREEFVGRLNKAWTTAGLPVTMQPLRWMRSNHPFAVYHSNPRNIAIFNNGTYHINLTMPTRLSMARRPANGRGFVRRHQAAARYFQWIEPFLIAIYGSPDPLAKSRILGHRFAAGSQRLAASRYTGVGSYNTHEMRQGKLNTLPRAEVRVTAEDGWMTSYGREAAYVQLEDVGMDINFHKHYNHGLELRFFDYFSEERLPELLATLVQALDQAGAAAAIGSPGIAVAPDSALWNVLVEEVMMRGHQAQVYQWMCAELSMALKLEVRPGNMRAVWLDLQKQLEMRWLGRGECSRVMIRRRTYLWDHIERPLAHHIIQEIVRQTPAAVASAVNPTGRCIAATTATAALPIVFQEGETFEMSSPMQSKTQEQRDPILPTISEVGTTKRKACVGCCTQ